MITDSLSDMSNERADLELLQKHTAQLAEQFDTVQIFCTRYVSDESDSDCGTASVTDGTGNWFARRGQVSEWLVKQDEQTKVHVRREETEDD